jgi:hypothetical protein
MTDVSDEALRTAVMISPWTRLQLASQVHAEMMRKVASHPTPENLALLEAAETVLSAILPPRPPQAPVLAHNELESASP